VKDEKWGKKWPAEARNGTVNSHEGYYYVRKTGVALYGGILLKGGGGGRGGGGGAGGGGGGGGGVRGGGGGGGGGLDMFPTKYSENRKKVPLKV